MMFGGNDVTPAAINLNDDNITGIFWCCTLCVGSTA